MLNTLALRMAAPGAHLSPASRTNGHSRRSRLKVTSDPQTLTLTLTPTLTLTLLPRPRSAKPHTTALPHPRPKQHVQRRGYCEVSSR